MCQTLQKNIQDADKFVILTRVKGEDKSDAILQPSDIPPTITKLRIYFEIILPNRKGCNINPCIRLVFYGDHSTIIESSEYNLRQNGIYLYLKLIQHGDTQKYFYLQNFIPDKELEFCDDSLEKDTQKHRQNKERVHEDIGGRAKNSFEDPPHEQLEKIHRNEQLQL